MTSCSLRNVFELANVGADDVAALLARHDDEAANSLGAHLGFDTLYDRVQLFDGAAAERVGALAFAIEDRPGDAFAVDREAPVLQLSTVGLGRYVSHRSPQQIQTRPGSFCCQALGTTRVMAKRHIIRFHFRWIEMVDGDHASNELSRPRVADRLRLRVMTPFACASANQSMP